MSLVGNVPATMPNLYRDPLGAGGSSAVLATGTLPSIGDVLASRYGIGGSVGSLGGVTMTRAASVLSFGLGAGSGFLLRLVARGSGAGFFGVSVGVPSASGGATATGAGTERALVSAASNPSLWPKPACFARTTTAIIAATASAAPCTVLLGPRRRFLFVTLLILAISSGGNCGSWSTMRMRFGDVAGFSGG